MPTAVAVPVIAPVLVVIDNPPGKEPEVTEKLDEFEAPHKSAAGIPAALVVSKSVTVVSTAFVNVGAVESADKAPPNSPERPDGFVTFTLYGLFPISTDDFKSVTVI